MMIFQILPKEGINLRVNNIKKSIKKTLMSSYFFIIGIMVIPSIYSLYVSSVYSRQYSAIIINVSKANRLNQIVKMDISDEIWDIVAGKQSFREGIQYDIIHDVETILSKMIDTNKQSQAVKYLEVALRALNTLKKYVDLLETQINENVAVEKNEIILEEVRGVSTLIHEILQDYIVAEIESAAKTNEAIKRNSVILTFIQVLITLVVLLYALYSQTEVSKQIREPIHQVELLSSKLAGGNLSARTEISRIEELENLTVNLNIMAEKIQELMIANIKEQENFQKEQMKSLQAQITPHFLYNTFDTIIWLAESSYTDEVIKITKAFSSFFRISLSKGHEWITVGQELEHVKSYLTIQKIRYRDILDYEIQVDKDVENLSVLKLVLQPLVENAIYHGIKNIRGRGLLKVSVVKSINTLHFNISDNGIGIDATRLELIRKELASSSGPEQFNTVYGLYNVAKRLSLYYKGKTTFVINSVYGEGTSVSFSVPIEAANV